MIIGSHCRLQLPDMFLGSVNEALSYCAKALMVYTGPPQSTMRVDISRMKINEAKALMQEKGIDLNNLVIHAPYIMNPATSDPEKHDFCINFLSSEIIRSYQMGSNKIVLHPGNALELDRNVAMNNVIEVLNKVILNTKDYPVTICLETMAGKGSEVGITFEEIKYLIDGVEDKSRIGVCLDTCHISDAGYDIIDNYDDVMNEFDKIVGFNYLKVIHVNDSKNPTGAHKDRHENIGKGYIGLKPLSRICHDERFKAIPKILETPYIDGNAPYKEEIELIINN